MIILTTLNCSYQLRKCASINLLQSKKKDNVQYARFSRTSIRPKYCPSLECGLDYLRNPHFNKSLGFVLKERQTLRLQGLLPPSIRTLDEQVRIADENFERYNRDLNKFIFLSDLQDHNQVLFYSLLHSDIEKFLPIVYSPTIGEACQQYAFVFKKPKGIFITIQDRGKIYKLLSNWPVYDINVISVTDGESVLNLGDLGAHGMGVPVGKLTLFTALAGVKPRRCLPVTLDVGTNNKSLLSDPFYIGLRQERVKNEEYFEFVDEFMHSCVRRYGNRTIIQFGEFSTQNATHLLEKYKKDFCTFNDNIQGTGAVGVAGLYGAVKIQKAKLSDNTYFFYGAGCSGCGIATLLVEAMKEEGLGTDQCLKKIFMFDDNGLVTNKRQEGVPVYAARFAKDLQSTKDLLKCIETLKPTCLIGSSTVGGGFTQDVLKQMAKNSKRPIVFALSSPQKITECTAKEAYEATKGSVIFSSTLDYQPVQYNDKVYKPARFDNGYVFPGLGLGAFAVNAIRITDEMFLTAAKTVARMVTEKELESGCIYPAYANIRKISYEVAKDVASLAYAQNIAGILKPETGIDGLLNSSTYKLEYPRHDPDLYEYHYDAGFKVKSFEMAHHEYKSKKNKKDK